MSYEFEKEKIYRMPTHFGPSLGPRQGPDGRKFECKDNPKTKSISVSFLTNPDQLQSFLPPNFSLYGDPIVNVTASYIKEIEWLAGRGYNTLGVSFPVEFNGEKDKARGNFLLVLWENLTDPILTGREELGFSKIYCKLPEPKIYKDKISCAASWLDFNFMNMEVNKISSGDIQLNKPKTDDKFLKGMLHYKYIPKTGGFPGSWGEKDIAYAVLTPEYMPNKVVKSISHGQGEVNFTKARWEDMPTQYTIVNAFADLEKIKYLDATVTETVGLKDISDQRILL
ncbi:MAG: acetoacetate decarboxylase family protein [Chloroflexota bacterium]|nr:acetoacetate decarboxylase family protein [Chloroflexota bacterium]